MLEPISKSCAERHKIFYLNIDGCSYKTLLETITFIPVLSKKIHLLWCFKFHVLVYLYESGYLFSIDLIFNAHNDVTGFTSRRVIFSQVRAHPFFHRLLPLLPAKKIKKKQQSRQMFDKIITQTHQFLTAFKFTKKSKCIRVYENLSLLVTFCKKNYGISNKDLTC